MKKYTPRPIPSSLKEMQVIVSYSDVQGARAGIGAAVWAPWLHKPLAVYMEVPERVRRHWSGYVDETGTYNDIFLVEALGALVLLVTFPKVIKDALWLHYSDNSAAEASLIRGSSSLEHGDVVVGLTWSMIQSSRLWAYFDRVESKSNPVDGLSRGDFSGPWENVHVIKFPMAALRTFAASCGDSFR